MRECKLDKIESDCILYCKKLKYQTDWHKIGFLNDFYDELVKYVIEQVSLNSIIEYILDSINSTQPPSEQVSLTDKEMMDAVYQYFKNEDGVFNSNIESFFNNHTIIFDHIYFPQHDSRDKFDYTKILYKLHKIRFNYCKFYTSHFNLNSIEVFFDECEFYDNYSISNSKILKNESNIIYQMCVFNNHVSVSYIDGKESMISNTLFRDCQFKKSIVAHNIEFTNSIFNNSEHNKYTDIYKLEIYDCIIQNDFILKAYTVHILDISETTFNGKVKIQFCKFLSNAIFYNTKFNNLADFYRTKFSTVNFEKTDFNQIAVFSEAVFCKDLHFKYTKFMKKSIFRDMVIKGKLDLRNTIFDDEANFLDITSSENTLSPTPINVENRETARVIKNFYENSNNVIEANKFYTLEMQERENELNKDLKQGRNLFEWITFKIHSISSNHSQDWVLAGFWIVCITLLYSHLQFTLKNEKTEYYVLPLIINALIVIFSFLAVNLSKHIANIYKLLIIVSLFAIYGFATGDFELTVFSNNINPFSIMTHKDTLNILTLVYKITIAYLIYQFIISIRQNTRRK